MTANEARAWLAEGTHFMAGSMAPKIEACLEFLDAGGEEAIITRPELLEEALEGRAGTHIVP
jgi:carbamate kinase